ncbi:hypothetical protein [Amazonocrinis nigriterrae]|uniref:hypothetical protein n=1 Tax=Amazonocrinis nigriterrae TaxID=2840443 RepID=UPI001BE41CDB|nr:hypothetical protein [Amazonocrinis nigriterrae]
MSNFTKISRFFPLTIFVASAVLATVPINTDQSSVFAQEIKPTTTSSLIAQYRNHRRDRYRDNYGTRILRAESGPDNRGRWRFYKPEDVSRDAMQAQGCTDVSAGAANWRCPRSTIRVEIDNDNWRPDRDRDDRYGRSTRRLRAESGPDDRGRWRFYKPEDVSRDAMQAQGCVDVGAGAANWRCPRPTIRVEVGDDNWRDRDRDDRYERSTRRLRAESGPDDKGRWRFYKPEDISRDAMQAEGCTDVGAGAANWRCPRPTIRVEVDN